jgi:hypothetical protein
VKKYSPLVPMMILAILVLGVNPGQAAQEGGPRVFEVPRLPDSLQKLARKAPPAAMTLTTNNGRTAIPAVTVKEGTDGAPKEDATANELVRNHLLKGESPLGLWVDDNDTLRYYDRYVILRFTFFDEQSREFAFAETEQKNLLQQFMSQAKVILNAAGIESFEAGTTFSVVKRDGQPFTDDKLEKIISERANEIFRATPNAVRIAGAQEIRGAVELNATGDLKTEGEFFDVRFNRDDQVPYRSKLRRLSRQIAGQIPASARPTIRTLRGSKIIDIPVSGPAPTVATAIAVREEGEPASDFLKEAPHFERMLGMITDADPAFGAKIREQVAKKRIIRRPVFAFTDNQTPLDREAVQFVPGTNKVEIAQLLWGDEYNDKDDPEKIRRTYLIFPAFLADILPSPADRPQYAHKELRHPNEYDERIKRAEELADKLKLLVLSKTADGTTVKNVPISEVVKAIKHFCRGTYTQRLMSLKTQAEASKGILIGIVGELNLPVDELNRDYDTWLRKLDERIRIAETEDYNYVLGSAPPVVPLTVDQELTRLESDAAEAFAKIRKENSSDEEKRRKIETIREAISKGVSGLRPN